MTEATDFRVRTLEEKLARLEQREADLEAQVKRHQDLVQRGKWMFGGIVALGAIVTGVFAALASVKSLFGGS